MDDDLALYQICCEAAGQSYGKSMIFQWQIFITGEKRCTVSSITEQGAIDFWFNHFGSASKYSGIGRDQVEAVRL